MGRDQGQDALDRAWLTFPQREEPPGPVVKPRARAGSRWLDGAQRGDAGGTGPEILLGYPADEGDRVAAGHGLALAAEPQRVEAGSLELPGGGQRHVQDRA